MCCTLQYDLHTHTNLHKNSSLFIQYTTHFLVPWMRRNNECALRVHMNPSVLGVVDFSSLQLHIFPSVLGVDEVATMDVHCVCI